jgi:hypothetical protein
MAKTLTDFFEMFKGTNIPKDDKKFLDPQHSVEKTPDANGNGDDVFSGAKVKYAKRSPSPDHGGTHGNDPGEDVKDWEKLNPKKKIVKEEAEQIDEARYSGESPDDHHIVVNTKAKVRVGHGKVFASHKAASDYLDYHKKFNKGFDVPHIKVMSVSEAEKHGVDKDSYHGLGVFKEDVEQIDEISKKVLKSYVKKATTSSERSWNKADKEEDKAMSTDGEKYPEKQKRHQDAASQHINTWNKREAGLKVAKQKLTKEDIINRAIANYLPEQKTLDERLAENLAEMPKFAVDIITEMFESLNEDNQRVVIEETSTVDGINSVLDFAISKRDI